MCSFMHEYITPYAIYIYNLQTFSTTNNLFIYLFNNKAHKGKIVQYNKHNI